MSRQASWKARLNAIEHGSYDMASELAGGAGDADSHRSLPFLYVWPAELNLTRVGSGPCQYETTV
jgi:hypothetical protein